MRVLVTGSRMWTDKTMIENVLFGIDRQASVTQKRSLPQITLVHGDCPTGADRLADEIAHDMGWEIERHPANWRPKGKFIKNAGMVRNAEMVNSGIDICLAFIKNHSRGSTQCADLAEKAGIETRRYLG